jgi:hypothetical protein
MAIRRTLAEFSDDIASADIADNAVTTAKIADSQITAAKVAADVATQAELNVVSAAVDAVDTSAGIKPHIRTGILYPAVAGNDLDGTDIDTSHGSTYTYGTAHTDGRKYYYTDIKGSKPIKDPRIGAHFGSQRHKFKSIQLLEQETVTHGENVYSFDGREWIRAVASYLVGINDASGQDFQFGNNVSGDTEFIEIIGYFNQANILGYCNNFSPRTFTSTVVNGGTAHTTDTTFQTSISTPLQSRYVDACSLVKVEMETITSPQITTLKLVPVDGAQINLYGIELIAQDTTSTTTKSQIQIPAQNVVSYGKKFAVSAATPHYNPFAFKTDGSTAWASGAHNGTAWPVGTGSSANIDTATSLGLDAWVSTNYYKPYNGGRVVWWVDSSGTLKCSVNMMPPNARSIANSASLTNGTEKGDDSAGTSSAAVANNTFYPTFTDQAIDHSQAEVAKTFHYAEFGNGNANGGATGTYKDASMLDSTSRDIAYVMDDGLTSLSGDDVHVSNTSKTFLGYADGDSWYVTFIGTGISFSSVAWGGGWHNIVQNLPYGTHILKVSRDADADPDLVIDGVALNDASLGNYSNVEEFTFHQPKMPPIPEDAVVIADYMLMADYVKQTDCEATEISKGVRYVSGSRDHFVNAASALAANVVVFSSDSQFGLSGGASPSSSNPGIWKLPFFGTTGQSMMEGSNLAHSITLGGSATTETALDNSVVDDNDMMTIAETVTLGQTNIETTVVTGGMRFYGHHVVSPIHTSSHYQTFETPFLHELVGGDRNMEQTNLVVTPDGKTWDEVTRNTDYMGAQVHRVNTDSNYTAGNDYAYFDEHRGVPSNSGGAMGWKNWVHGYDRQICLRDGTYKIYTQTLRNTVTSYHGSIYLNGTVIVHGHAGSSNHDTITTSITRDFKRGDYIQIRGGRAADMLYSQFEIIRMEN